MKAQLKNDWTGASTVTINGVTFAPVGHDGESEISNEDLELGLQERIWDAVTLIANALDIEIQDCR